jgi:hypothetical protein
LRRAFSLTHLQLVRLALFGAYDRRVAGGTRIPEPGQGGSR